MMEQPLGKKRKVASTHSLSSRHSAVSTNWDEYLGTALNILSQGQLPTVKTVLQRYRCMRTEYPTEKVTSLVSKLREEVTAI